MVSRCLCFQKVGFVATTIKTRRTTRQNRQPESVSGSSVSSLKKEWPEGFTLPGSQEKKLEFVSKLVTKLA